AQQSFDTYLSECSDKKDHERIKLQTAVIALEQGDSQKAQTVLKELQSSEDPDMAAEASARLGAIYLRTEDWTSARKAFNFAIERGSQKNAHRLQAISQLAALYESEHAWQKAVITYKLLAESTSEKKWKLAAQERILALERILSESSTKGAN
ncbi:hypothetical protein MJD09_17765, partial [bacterium]|nr:hypothetical protein [bacterium]